MKIAVVSLALLLSSASGPAPAQDLESLYREAVAASPTPVRLRQDHGYWVEEGSDPADDRFRRRMERSLAADRATAAIRPTFDDLGRDCLDLGLDQGCGVVSVGFLKDAPGGGDLYWQIQAGANAEDGVGGGVLLFVEDGDRLRPVLWDFRAWRYEAPQMLLSEDGRPLLALRGQSRGTSNSPMDLLYGWSDDHWVQIDTEQWWDEVAGMADGLTLQSEARIDFEHMRAVTPLWRERDGHCCPTGGWAQLRFEIRNDVLHLTEVRHTP